MAPILDPRSGDFEDDASSTKARKLASIAGSMLAEISFPKLIAAWLILIGIPGVMLGLAPLIASAWLAKFSDKLAAISGAGSLIAIVIALAIGWYGFRPIFRFVERSFWALHALAVQPVYALFREGLSHVAEAYLDVTASGKERSRRRAYMAAVAGMFSCALAGAIVVLVWPWTLWSASFDVFAVPSRLIVPALANAVAIVGLYLAISSLAWGLSDALMDQPEELQDFASSGAEQRQWRIAHLSDLHVVGERYGFRIESGRSGPRGNERLQDLLKRLDAIHTEKPIDVVLVTGDMTDAGRSSEWAEFLEQSARFPHLLARMIVLPGNHDVNIAERTNPAKIELPISPVKVLRHMRTLSAMDFVQGRRAHVCDKAEGQISTVLSDALAPFRSQIASFADQSGFRNSFSLWRLWADVFPLVFPPEGDHGLGIIVLNTNAQSNFSFTNALGLVPAEDVAVACRIMQRYPEAAWIVAIHHHAVEYPLPVKAFSERIGTALINGSWFVRRLRPFADRIVIMHGHRHIDWIGRVGAVTIVSAPSPVMNAGDSGATHFYLHTVAVDSQGRVQLVQPERINLPGRHSTPELDVSDADGGKHEAPLSAPPV
jgi:hypothetical protein